MYERSERASGCWSRPGSSLDGGAAASRFGSLYGGAVDLLGPTLPTATVFELGARSEPDQRLQDLRAGVLEVAVDWL